MGRITTLFASGALAALSAGFAGLQISEAG
jgi:hypothetical protein